MNDRAHGHSHFLQQQQQQQQQYYNNNRINECHSVLWNGEPQDEGSREA
jgi:hypothetical protein